MKAALYTLGCKVNQYETQVIGEALVKAGYLLVPPDEQADIYIINSCTVTAESDKKTRQTVRHYKRLHPNALVVLTGCMPQAYPQAAAELTQADIVTGNRSTDKIVSLIEEYFKEKERLVRIQPHRSNDYFVPCAINEFEERTRAALKIEDGCNRFCSYCVIPYARGRVRSKPLEDIEREAQALAENGFREIVLVGINLSAYGLGSDKTICDAIEAIAQVNGIERIRLGSLEPDHLTAEIIRKMAQQPKLCPQFHISLQSGCTATLKRMNRHYTAEEYAVLCQNLREQFKDCTLTTDVMVGFAGETNDEFEQSLAFVKKIKFEKVHVFPYSPRKGTRAAEFEGQVEKSVKEERTHRMIEATEKIRAEFLQKQIGKIVRVLAETNEKDGSATGYTANYTPVRIASGAVCGEFYDVKILDATENECIGIIR
ncbi:MAG TPA: tRNA (N(6)-L-threonylcarbamoyladenosine(37)-C(2))-methylthiotransferase MtaB [Ruminococcaceae bacterium]|nr:tRNA (N(6)-L-threonylcarbamoyladenosine(37)-C(2))-methylthiotransferase MtaB [Oscillospiraceae bacterium]